MGPKGASETGHRIRLLSKHRFDSLQKLLRRPSNDLPEQIFFRTDVGIEATPLQMELPGDIPDACGMIATLAEEPFGYLADVL
jgi:hypothetical protein